MPRLPRLRSLHSLWLFRIHLQDKYTSISISVCEAERSKHWRSSVITSYCSSRRWQCFPFWQLCVVSLIFCALRCGTNHATTYSKHSLRQCCYSTVKARAIARILNTEPLRAECSHYLKTESVSVVEKPQKGRVAIAYYRQGRVAYRLVGYTISIAYYGLHVPFAAFRWRLHTVYSLYYRIYRSPWAWSRLCLWLAWLHEYMGPFILVPLSVLVYILFRFSFVLVQTNLEQAFILAQLFWYKQLFLHNF